MEEKLILGRKVTLFMQVTKLFKALEKLPKFDENIKLISLGGFSSISFILRVAEEETIEELYASSLRVGKKEIIAIESMKKKNKINKCTFLVGSLMTEDKKTKYNYWDIFTNICKKNNWNYFYANNHSKIILMKTDKNYYVLETSSNLNENPKIEQYSFYNDKEAYEFYKNFFEYVKERSDVNEQRATSKEAVKRKQNNI